MKTFLFALAMLGGVASAQTPNALSGKEKKEGWKLLFDGKTTTGWHTYLKDSVGSAWKVQDGALVFSPSANTAGRGDLVTNEEFENYELSLEWKISDGGNSGIIFSVKEDPKFSATYLTGAEMQVLDNVNAKDNKKDNHLAGSLYDMLVIPGSSKPKAVGEWNLAKIQQKDRHLTLWLNGNKTAEVQIGSEEWKALIANSKFKTWADFAASAKGKIALQDHGNEVTYRNIKIRTL
jgi:hypothetical protein